MVPAVWSGGHVQGPDPGSADHGERGTHAVPEPRSAELAAVPGLCLGAVTPDENTLQLFRETLTRAGVLDALFTAFERQLRERGYLPMGGPIVDAAPVVAHKQRNTAAGSKE